MELFIALIVSSYDLGSKIQKINAEFSGHDEAMRV
jgi:hypothetical protein